MRAILRPVLCATAALALTSAAAFERPPSADAARLEFSKAAAYSRRHGGQALLIRRGGRTLHEEYAKGLAPDHPFWLLSITKNLWGMAAIAAEADGILSMDEPVSRTIPEWRKDSRKSRITLRELLNQSSGLGTGFHRLYDRTIRDKNDAAINVPALRAPGEFFDYGPSHFEVFAEVLTRKLAKRSETPLAYLRRRILNPIAAEYADWRTDKTGQPYFSTGARMTARDLAKFADLVQQRGRMFIWRAFPRSAFDRNVAGSPANRMYGLSFWLNERTSQRGASEISIEQAISRDPAALTWAAACLSRAAPPDLIAMVGSGGQRAYVVPSQKLTIVRFGSGREFSDAEFLRLLYGGRR
jgi:CubicO group peptidase (beta-lactamase class C family)